MIFFAILLLQKKWCREPESNRYGSHLPQDFKSCASASSATPARVWSGRRDSNPRPPPWQGGVLPLNYFRIVNNDFLSECSMGHVRPNYFPFSIILCCYTNAGEGS